MARPTDDEKPALPRVRNQADLREAIGDGHEYPKSFVDTICEEHQLAVAAFHRPRSLLLGRVRPTMFVGKDYKIFWQAAESVLQKTTKPGPLDIQAVSSEMRTLGHAPPQGFDTLAEVLSRSLPADAHYVEENLVGKKIARHELLRIQETTQKLNDRVSVDPDPGLFGEYISAAQDIGRIHGAGGRLQSLGEQMQSWDPADAALRIVPSGLDVIDGVSGGGPGKGDLVVIGGGTNAGKSMACEQLLYTHSALGEPVLYLSIEDEEDIMRCRAIARHTDPKQRPVWIRKPPSKPEELLHFNAEAVAKAKAIVEKDRNMYVARKRKGRVSDVIDVLRRYRYEQGIVAAMVDYLQALTPDHEAKGSPNIVQETARKVAQLKEAADNLGIPIYLTSQLARDEFKNGAEPELTSCKYAGDIENEAEILLLLWRTPDQKLLHAKVAKAKWVETTVPRYIIRTDPVTGIFGRWEPSFPDAAATGGQTGGHRPQGQARGGGGGRTRGGSGRQF